MSQPRKFHLFNCDNIYELSVVENLLKAVKAKLGFKFSAEKHNFTLSEMSELSSKCIPEMQMDFAMFVVHAHESVLFINNDNLEYGYAKVYRALMAATGNYIKRKAPHASSQYLICSLMGPRPVNALLQIYVEKETVERSQLL